MWGYVLFSVLCDISDLLHPACVDVVQVGSLVWCLHLHKNTTHEHIKASQNQDDLT